MTDAATQTTTDTTTQAPPGAAGATTPPPDQAPRWWEKLPDAERQFVTAKGLTLDDPAAVMPKVIEIARHAESRIGRGLDTIIDKPKAGQPVHEWLKSNAAALGLPDKPEGYKVAPPETWPKDLKWNDTLDGRARELAAAHGVPPDAHKAYVALFAEHMAEIHQAPARELQLAQTRMMQDLERDFGDQVPVVIARARQAAQAVAAEAGLDARAIENVGMVLAEKTGDAATIRLFDAIGRLMGEDRAAALGKGGALTLTPAEARAELARWQSPGSEWFEASAKGDRAALDRLRPQYQTLLTAAAR